MAKVELIDCGKITESVAYYWALDYNTWKSVGNVGEVWQTLHNEEESSTLRKRQDREVMSTLTMH